MSDSERIRRAEGLPHQKIDDQTLVVVPRKKEVHLLNPTATRVWELLERETTVDELVKALTEEYDVDAGTARRDVEAALAEMKQKGLLA
jgi:PqqD family protein of HPr-rel-A system